MLLLLKMDVRYYLRYLLSLVQLEERPPQREIVPPEEITDQNEIKIPEKMAILEKMKEIRTKSRMR